MKLRHFIFLTLLSLTLPAAAAIRLANIFGDGMLLQQNSTVVLRGDANPGAIISVNPGWSGKALATKADADGKWALSMCRPLLSADLTTSSLRKTESKALLLAMSSSGKCGYALDKAIWKCLCVVSEDSL